MDLMLAHLADMALSLEESDMVDARDRKRLYVAAALLREAAKLFERHLKARAPEIARAERQQRLFAKKCERSIRIAKRASRKRARRKA